MTGLYREKPVGKGTPALNWRLQSMAWGLATITCNS